MKRTMFGIAAGLVLVTSIIAFQTDLQPDAIPESRQKVKAEDSKSLRSAEIEIQNGDHVSNRQESKRAEFQFSPKQSKKKSLPRKPFEMTNVSESKRAPKNSDRDLLAIWNDNKPFVAAKPPATTLTRRWQVANGLPAESEHFILSNPQTAILSSRLGFPVAFRNDVISVMPVTVNVSQSLALNQIEFRSNRLSPTYSEFTHSPAQSGLSRLSTTASEQHFSERLNHTAKARELYVATNFDGTPNGFDIPGFIGAGTFYNLGTTGSNARVAIIELGTVWTGHETLSQLPSSQYIAYGPNLALNPHTTVVASIAVGSGAGDVQKGIAYGLSEAGSSGLLLSGGLNTSSTNQYVYQVLRDAAIDGADKHQDIAGVANQSWGYLDYTYNNGSWSTAKMNDLVTVQANDGLDGVVRRGFTNVLAAANAGPSPSTVASSSAGFNGFVVSALGPINDGHFPFNVIAKFSSRGPQAIAIPPDDYFGIMENSTDLNARAMIDIAAPGQNLWVPYTTTQADYFESGRGTSYAAPVITGAVALLNDRATEIYPRNLADAMDGRVTKAVLMNMADKTAFWNQGGTSGLDPNVGAGRVNLDQARFQFDTGFGSGFSAMPAPNTQVANSGWTRQASVGQGLSQTYEMQTSVDKFQTITATLSWYAVHSLYNISSNNGARVFYQNFHNLDLYVDRLTGPGGTIVDTIASATLYNATEHINFLAPADGYYQIRIVQQTPIWNFNGSLTTNYGLAWAARPSEVVATGNKSQSASLAAVNLLVAPDSSQTASLNIDGASTVYRVNQSVHIGGAPSLQGLPIAGGTGTVTVSNGATLMVSDTMRLYGTQSILAIDQSQVMGGYLDLGTAKITSSQTSSLGFTSIVSNSGTVTSTSGKLTLPPFDENWPTGTQSNIATWQNDGPLTLGGTGDIDVGNKISGVGSISKVGSGTVTLNADNSYSGSTQIHAGVLNIAGENTGVGTITVNDGAKLNVASTGTISGTIDVNGVNSVITTGTGIVNFESNSHLKLTATSGFDSTASGQWTLATLSSGDNFTFDDLSITNGSELGRYVQGTGSSGRILLDLSLFGYTLNSSDYFEMNLFDNTIVLNFTPVPESECIIIMSTLLLMSAAIVKFRT